MDELNNIYTVETKFFTQLSLTELLLSFQHFSFDCIEISLEINCFRNIVFYLGKNLVLWTSRSELICLSHFEPWKNVFTAKKYDKMLI